MSPSQTVVHRSVVGRKTSGSGCEGTLGTLVPLLRKSGCAGHGFSVGIHEPGLTTEGVKESCEFLISVPVLHGIPSFVSGGIKSAKSLDELAVCLGGAWHPLSLEVSLVQDRG